MLKHGMEGTALGTIIMPYCSGLGNLLFVLMILVVSKLLWTVHVSVQFLDDLKGILTCALSAIAGFVILALNGIATRLELQHSADPALP